MADKKISQLTALSAANVASATDVLAIVDTSATETKKITAKDLIDGALNGGTANGVLYLNGSKVATSGSALVFDGTNLGVGTTSLSSFYSGGRQLVVGSGSSGQGISIYTGTANEGGIYFADGTAGNDTVRGQVVYNHSANALYFSTDATERMRLTSSVLSTDSSINVGIGTASPASKLDVRSGYITGGTASATNGSKLLANYYTSGALATWGAEYSNGGPIMGYGVWPSTSAASSFVSSTAIASARGAYTIVGAEHKWFSGASQTVAIDSAVTTTQAMTLDASGNLLVGTTTPAGYRFRVYDGISQFTQATSATDCGDFWNRATSGDNKFVSFYTESSATSRGSITYNRGAGQVAYNVTSDVRLKENISDAVEAGSKIDAMQVRQFDWKETGNHLDYGFVAQELHDVAPHAVSKPEDDDKMWSVDYSKLVPMLVKEVQSLRKRVAELEAK